MHYWGAIKGSEGSLAAISIFKNEVIGFYSSQQNGNFVLGKLGGNNPRRDHILYAEKDLTGSIPVDCDMPDGNNARHWRPFPPIARTFASPLVPNPLHQRADLFG